MDNKVAIPIYSKIAHNVHVKIEKLNNFVKLPVYSSADAAGADLHAATSAFIPLGSTAVISCGFKMALPPLFEAQVRSRSGLAAKGVVVANSPGTIDSDYRGEVKVILNNQFYANDLSEYPGEPQMLGLKVNVGDRIAQMIISPVFRAVFSEVDKVDDTERGEGGLGSTGK